MKYAPIKITGQTTIKINASLILLKKIKQQTQNQKIENAILITSKFLAKKTEFP
ncbi:hypothetical protein M6G53_12905 [Serratia nevei]|uniref:hypothetical protein n=1 Tax=Serratia nevei TaxID=2703794 RepID=UPI0020A10705|nr:hypothetical protein [Serratia nevei]MCP1106286.1 hypothetical protein [Serratia nevei]